MDSFFVALNTVLPLFLLMVVGYFTRLAGILSEISTRQVNKLIFRVFLPVLVFCNIYRSDSFGDLRSSLFIFAAAGVLIEFLLGIIITLLTEQENARRGVMLQGMFRSNFVLYGIPISTALLGQAAAGRASVLIAVVIPLFNVLAVLALEMFNGQRPNLGHVLLGILTNPLIWASGLGIACNYFGVSFPQAVDSTLSSLGGMATPLAFVVLGASLNFGETGRCMRPLLTTLSVKLVLFPAAALGIALLMGFRGIDLAVLLTLFGSPIAVSSFTMAQEMGGDEQLAGQLVVFSSVLSIGTMFLLIWGLKYFAFL